MQTRLMPVRRVKPGYYEIESKASRLFLDSLDDFQHNNWSDDALTLAEFPTRRGKVLYLSPCPFYLYLIIHHI